MLRSWVYGIVRRTVSTYRRRRRVREATELFHYAPFAADLASLQPSVLELAALSEEAKVLWMLLGVLTPRQREVLILADMEEMTVPEIAVAVGVPLNTAYSRLRAARRNLSSALKRHCLVPLGRPCAHVDPEGGRREESATSAHSS